MRFRSKPIPICVCICVQVCIRINVQLYPPVALTCAPTAVQVGSQRIVVLNGLVILEWNPPPGIGIDRETQVYVHLGLLVKCGTVVSRYTYRCDLI